MTSELRKLVKGDRMRLTTVPRLLLLVLTLSLFPGAYAAAEEYQDFDALELDTQLADNDLKAQALSQKSIRVSGEFYSVRAINKDGKDIYLVKFAGYAGLAPCTRITCYFFNKTDLEKLSKGQRIRVSGKVSAVSGDTIGILVHLLEF